MGHIVITGLHQCSYAAFYGDNLLSAHQPPLRDGTVNQVFINKFSIYYIQYGYRYS